ncbi:hypothetical protein PJP07_31145, partial [Mycobacterium kansasii]
ALYGLPLQVLVHGWTEMKEHLKQYYSKNVCPHVYASQIEETIDVKSDLCAYKVSVGMSLSFLWTSNG